ncbi:MAG: hypothetical protein WC523_02425 [Patescibacteria group bacterium]
MLKKIRYSSFILIFCLAFFSQIAKINAAEDYPGINLRADKTEYQTSDTISLSLSRTDNSSAAYPVDIYVVKSLENGTVEKKLIDSNFVVNGQTTKTISIANESYFANNGAGTYVFSVCKVNACTETVNGNLIFNSNSGPASTIKISEDPIVYELNSSSTSTSAVAGATVADSTVSAFIVQANSLNNAQIDRLLDEIKSLRSTVQEQANQIKYLQGLTQGVNITADAKNALNNFITYGSDSNTKQLGAGERAAVIYSYKNAFDKLPTTAADLTDVIKIASGRWPSATSAEAENRAKVQFQKIYQRPAVMTNSNDNAAVTVMAYGLRQKATNRNLQSEQKGIMTFKSIYGHTPSTTAEWNIMQAITYSGATR